MRSKIIAIWSLLTLTVFSLALAIFSTLIDLHDCGIVSNVSYGVFGSSLVSFIIVLIEYITQLKRTEENFYVEYNEFLSNLINIKYLCIKKEEIALSKYLTNKKMFWKYDSEGKETFINEFINDLYKNDTFLKNYSSVDLEKFIDNKANDFETRLLETIKLFVKFSEINLLNLDRHFADLFYLFNNKKQRLKIYDTLYLPAHEIKQAILRRACHFRDYIDGKGQNTAVMTNMVDELNKEIFKEENKGNSVVVFAEKYDQLSDELLKFYCKMYKKEYQPSNHQPIYASLRNCNIVVKSRTSK